MNGSRIHVAPWYQAEAPLRTMLERDDIQIVGHHVAYDLAVVGASWPVLLPLIFDAYDADRVTCTMRRQQLLDIATGKRQGFRGADGKWRKPKYGLDHLAQRFFGKQLAKAKKIPGCDACDAMQGKEPCYAHTPWQLRFGTLYDKPIETWPAEPIRYLIEDVETTDEIFKLQEAHAEFLQDQYRKARAFFGVQLMTMWGLRTSENGVRELEERTRRDWNETLAYLVDEKLCRPNGTRDTKAAQARMRSACAAAGFEPRLTEKGAVCLDADACNDSDHAPLKKYAELTTLGFLLSKDVAALRKGVLLPIHSRFDLAASGRMTSSSPNIQNWSRGQKIRECFYPRAGHVFLQADYDGLELRTLAQVCMRLVGGSELAKALNAGKDPHLMLAGNMIQKNYDWCVANAQETEVSEARQIAKIANFGYPGGLGAAAFADYAKANSGGKIIIPVEKDSTGRITARELKALWEYTWPEVKPYGQIIESWRIDPDKRDGYIFPQLFSQRLRGGLTYTSARNTGFQGLGADATQNAEWQLIRACYRDIGSPLFGARMVNYVHDEFFLEILETTPERMHMQGEALRTIMQDAANEFLPDVPATTSPVIMRYWSKAAHEVYDARGFLIPWSLAECGCKKCMKLKGVAA